MVKVSGSISATPIAAERPGRQPMTIPRDDAADHGKKIYPGEGADEALTHLL